MITTPSNAAYAEGTWELAWSAVGSDLPAAIRVISSTASTGSAEVLCPQAHGLGTESGWTPDEDVDGELLDAGRALVIAPGVHTGRIEVWVRTDGATVSVAAAGR